MNRFIAGRRRIPNTEDDDPALCVREARRRPGDEGEEVFARLTQTAFGSHLNRERLNLSLALVEQGASVDLLDADVYAPDIPLMVNLRRKQHRKSWPMYRNPRLGLHGWSPFQAKAVVVAPVGRGRRLPVGSRVTILPRIAKVDR
ncbi:MAG: Mrp/NBP35 family ATP-binding protein [Actinomycetota bacterium]|nr:Mrp/NBP35 family ATP-binding protein [Actinomycetota bacterium]